jgi:hypothetical protein
MFYIGTGKRIFPEDFLDIAEKNGIEYAALQAVCEIEAKSTGFTSANALICLYEPHVAYKYSTGAIRAALVKAGLAYQKWGTKPYPRTSYPSIDECAKIAGEEIACLSTSWGLPQMMGFNHKACGYDTALNMVKSFAESEYNQVEAMVEFIKASPSMFKALNGHDWATFARYYNGAGYAKNKYDQKLAKAYAYWKTMPLPKDETEEIKPIMSSVPVAPPIIDDDIDTPSMAMANTYDTLYSMFANFIGKTFGRFFK